jgi:hypothetical protein
VFLSSHLLSEMALTAEHLIVVGRGRLIRDMSVDDFIASASTNAVYVRSPDDARLRDVLLADGIEVASSEPGHLQVTGMTSDEIGYRAAVAGLTLLELTPVQASLEEAFMALTQDAVEYRAPRPPRPSPPATSTSSQEGSPHERRSARPLLHHDPARRTAPRKGHPRTHPQLRVDQVPHAALELVDAPRRGRRDGRDRSDRRLRDEHVGLGDPGQRGHLRVGHRPRLPAHPADRRRPRRPVRHRRVRHRHDPLDVRGGPAAAARPSGQDRRVQHRRAGVDDARFLRGVLRRADLPVGRRPRLLAVKSGDASRRRGRRRVPDGVGALGGALGWIVRSTAGAITALVALLLLLPVLVGFLPASVGTDIAKFLPGDAAEAFVSSGPVANALAPWTGLGVLVLWAALALAAATVLLRRRDA